MISPTRQGVRSDNAGDGHFNARRGRRRHRGVDFLCAPGQDIYMPITSGMVVRKRYPYAEDLRYEGLHIEGVDGVHAIELCLFYVVAVVSFHINYKMGDVIAYAQDITKKYGPPMQPHIHLQVERIDPLFLFKENSKWDWTA